MADTIQVDIPAPVEIIPQGFHAIMDCSSCELDKLENVDNLRAWLLSIGEIIGTDIVADATVTTTAFGHNIVQVFSDASVIARCVDQEQHIYIDIFSFKEFNPELVESAIKSSFGSGAKVNKILIPRNASV